MNFFDLSNPLKDKLISCYKFLNADPESNREWEAQLAISGRETWKHSFSLNEVIWYLRLENTYKTKSL